VADESIYFGTQQQCGRASNFGYFSQCSVIIKGSKHGSEYFTLSKFIPTPVRKGLFAGVLWWLTHLHCLALNSNVAGPAVLAASASVQS